METPAQAFEKMLREGIAKFSKTPFAIPVAIALVAGVHYLVMVYISEWCFASLITPLFMLAIFWMFNIRRIKKLLVLGLITCLPLMGVLTVVLVQNSHAVEPRIATSEDGILLTDGMLEPLRGDASTLFNFSITVNLQDNASIIQEARLILASISFPSGESYNITMDLVSSDDENLTYGYAYSTAVTKPVNQFWFNFQINNSWNKAGHVDENGELWVIEGPIFEDSWTLAAVWFPYTIPNAIFYSFVPFAIVCGMIWWTRRARRMRMEAIERLKKERAEEKAQLPKDEAKVPSLAKATGAEKEDTFVCSECGADVPADATVCPKCGEKFE